MNRSEELQLNWESVQQQVGLACAKANRSLDEVTIIAVTKTWPASDVDILANLGVRDVGENRDQEASEKKSQVNATDLTWHAIGQIQTNKVKSIVQWADVVHSIDRAELVTEFSKRLAQTGKTQNVFVQVNLDEQPSSGRGGAALTDALHLAELVLADSNFSLLGVMGVAPLGGDLERAFATLQEVSVRVQELAPDATNISAGMSDDYQIALKYGATHLRLGSLILGHRTYSG